MRVHVVGGHLGEVGTPTTLASRLARLQAADVVQTAAKILIWMETPGRDALRSGQQELVESLFPPALAEQFREALTLGGDAGGFDVVFYPGQLMAIQKLAFAVSQPGDGTSFEGGETIPDFVLAAAQVGDMRNALVPVPTEDWDEIDAAVFAFRSSEVDRILFPPTAGGRAYRMWLDSPLGWPDAAEHPEDYCARAFGVPLRTFVAVAAAPGWMRMSVDDVSKLRDMPFSISSYYSTTKIDPTTARSILQPLTFGHSSAPAAEIISDPATYWCFFDLAERPLLPCGRDLVVPCSVRYSLERATTYIFWMLHTTMSGDVQPLTDHFGRMFEHYLHMATRPLAGEHLTVSGEVEYGPASSRRKTSDILVTTRNVAKGDAARIFVECRAGRPPRSLFAAGSREALQRYVDDLVGKLRQLDRSIKDHVAGAFELAGDLARADDPYFPVLVVDTPFRWTFMLRNILDREIGKARLFRDPRVTAPIICSIDEYENLIHACEQGHDIVELLRQHLAEDRAEPLEQVVFEKTGPLRSPSYTKEGWSKLGSLMVEELFR